VRTQVHIPLPCFVSQWRSGLHASFSPFCLPLTMTLGTVPSWCTARPPSALHLKS
jgi:hypothetical protein